MKRSLMLKPRENKRSLMPLHVACFYNIMLFPNARIYSYAVTKHRTQEGMGGWAQIRLSILKLSDFEIRLPSVNSHLKKLIVFAYVAY